MGRERVGRYRLDRMLGKGGMGQVWLAFDTEAGRRVALKLLPAELAADPTYRARFEREAELAARLNDPHIVPIHAHGELDGRLFIDMGFIEGVDLNCMLRDNGVLSQGTAVDVVAQVATALDAAHAAGLVHRDVKPSNIVVGPDGFAYLIDFGIAHGSDATAVTTAGLAIGTWAYMAPERFSGRADARSDVYSLGCVLYECLTGARPFGNTDPAQQMHAHLTSDPPSVHRANPAVGRGLDTIIACAMAKNPDDRYRTAGDLAEAANAAAEPATRPGPGGTRMFTEARAQQPYQGYPRTVAYTPNTGTPWSGDPRGQYPDGAVTPSDRPSAESGYPATAVYTSATDEVDAVGGVGMPRNTRPPAEQQPGYPRTAAYTRFETEHPFEGPAPLPGTPHGRYPGQSGGAAVGAGSGPGTSSGPVATPAGYSPPQQPFRLPVRSGQRRVVFSGTRASAAAGRDRPVRRRGASRKLVIIVLLVLLAPCALGAGCVAMLASSGSDGNFQFRAGDRQQGSDTGSAAPAAVGDPVRDGKLEFVVTEIETEVDQVGVESADDGVFTVVGLTVRNTAAQTQTYLPLGQRLHDTTGREYDLDVTATAQRAATAAAPSNLEPGQSVATQLVYGVPPNSVPDHLTVRDFPFSLGSEAPLR